MPQHQAGYQGAPGLRPLHAEVLSAWTRGFQLVFWLVLGRSLHLPTLVEAVVAVSADQCCLTLNAVAGSLCVLKLPLVGVVEMHWVVEWLECRQ